MTITTTARPADRHVMPDHAGHEADPSCLCVPSRHVPCAQCAFPGERGCWACGGHGLVVAPNGHPGPFVYLHAEPIIRG